MKQRTPFSSHKHIFALFTTRNDGVSKAPYQENNLAFHVGDKEEDVIINHKTLAENMGYEYSKLVHMRQIHSDKIIIVEPEIHNFNHPPECDALITNLPKIPLMVMTADCTPVLFYDTQKQVIAVAHAGRSGALKGIVPKTLQMMQQHFNCDLKDIHVAIGPSIGVCCYEVGQEIVEDVTKAGYGLATVYENGRYSLDVNAIIREQLQKEGLEQTHLEDHAICNACNNENFFSYRADKQTTGRIAGILMLR